MIDRMIGFDIETAPQYETFSQVPVELAEFWRHKVDREGEMTIAQLDESWQSAGIYAEFGQIVCITVGYSTSKTIRVKSFIGTELEILTEFFALLAKHYTPTRHIIAGHNIKGFDIPYVISRARVLGLDIPPMLDVRGKKPWEMKFVYDTMEEWALGRYRANVSLNLLCHLLGVPSPKDGMDGSQVGKAFFEGRIDEIAAYCEKDVKSTFGVIKKLL